MYQFAEIIFQLLFQSPGSSFPLILMSSCRLFDTLHSLQCCFSSRRADCWNSGLHAWGGNLGSCSSTVSSGTKEDNREQHSVTPRTSHIDVCAEQLQVKMGLDCRGSHNLTFLTNVNMWSSGSETSAELPGYNNRIIFGLIMQHYSSSPAVTLPHSVIRFWKSLT